MQNSRAAHRVSLGIPAQSWHSCDFLVGHASACLLTCSAPFISNGKERPGDLLQLPTASFRTVSELQSAYNPTNDIPQASIENDAAYTSPVSHIFRSSVPFKWRSPPEQATVSSPSEAGEHRLTSANPKLGPSSYLYPHFRRPCKPQMTCIPPGCHRDAGVRHSKRKARQNEWSDKTYTLQMQ